MRSYSANHCLYKSEGNVAPAPFTSIPFRGDALTRGVCGSQPPRIPAMMTSANSCLAELTTNVVLGVFFFGAFKNLPGIAEFYEIACTATFRCIDVEKSR